MKSIAVKAVVLALVIGAGTLALTRTADAAHVVAEILGPDQIEVGRPAQLQVALRTGETGAPLANTQVTVYTEASFADVAGEIELGRAVTDESGVAVLDFEPRLAGERELRIEYLVPGESEAEVATTTLSVASGTQLHQSTSGVQIPGLNVWLIIALVAGVWSVLFSVGLRVLNVARAATNGEPVPELAVRSLPEQPAVAAREPGASEA
jgi:hypothetical protein